MSSQLAGNGHGKSSDQTHISREQAGIGTGRGVPDAIAIIGMACIFPGAPDLTTYWQNILDKVDAVTDPPPGAWNPDEFYKDEPYLAGQIYCKKGGYLAPWAEFNPLEYGIMPVGLDGGEPDQWLALKVAYDALKDANYLERLRANPAERQRTAVILGKGTYLNRGNLNMVQHSLVVDQTVHILHTLHPELTDAELQQVRQEMKQQLPPFNAESAPGLVPNIAAGRIANRLDLMGPAYTVDAACASSLIAMEHAVHELQSGRSDLALVGGVHVATPAPILALFCELGALSHQEEIRPFDARADGTILSEGIGMMLLKRAADAQRDGDRIYAVVKGVGSSSDGRGMSVLTPRLEGEILAVQRALAMAQAEPHSIGLIEAHGTGTAVGDRTEIQALCAVFGARDDTDPQALPTCALGTVKSMIGHTMPASGMAGMIKSALALYHKTLPPTIHVDEPDPRLEIERSPFYLNTEVRPWIHGDATTPRRAGVNAFGFGGVNAHVLLEEAPAPVTVEEQITPLDQQRVNLASWDSEVVVLAAATRAGLIEQAQRVLAYCAEHGDVALADLAYTLTTEAMAEATTLSGDPCRLTVVAESVADLDQKLQQAIARLEKPTTRQIKDVRGIYFFEESFYTQGRDGAQAAQQTRLAFLFPGEGAQYPNMLADLCRHFPEVRACFDQIDQHFAHHPRGFRPSDFIFPRPQFGGADSVIATQLWQIDGAVEAVLTANMAMWILLQKLGIPVDACVGHSTGEYTALLAAGAIAVSNEEFVGHYLMDLNRRYNEVLQETEVPRAVMAAIGTGLEQIQPIVDSVNSELPGAQIVAEPIAPEHIVYVSMDNCPHQTVVLGEASRMEVVMARAKEQGIIVEVLPFDRGYHSPLFAPYSSLFEALFNALPVTAPATPIYSCISADRFADEADKIRELATANWINRVRFRETIQKMYADGVRVFVEVGPRNNLSAFTGDILRGQPHLAVASNMQQRSGLLQLNHLLALLCAQQVPVNFDYYYQGRPLQRLSLDLTAADTRRATHTIRLATGWAGFELSPLSAQRLQNRTSRAAMPVQASPAATHEANSKTQLETLQEPETNNHRPAGSATVFTPLATVAKPSVSPSHDRNTGPQVEFTMDRRNHTPMNQLTSLEHALDQNGTDGTATHTAPRHAPQPGPTSNGASTNGHHSQSFPALPTVDESALVMQAHMELMQQFLQMQERLMMQFLDAGSNSAHQVVLPAVARPQRVLSPRPATPAPAPSAAFTAAPAVSTWMAPSTPPPSAPQHVSPASAAPAPQTAPTAPATSTPPATEAKATASPAAVPATATKPSAETMREILLRLVSERTGYPQEMLDLSANLEADLGIDSIKRVEIISAFNRETKLLSAKDIDHVSTLNNLGAMLDFFGKSSL